MRSVCLFVAFLAVASAASDSIVPAATQSGDKSLGFNIPVSDKDYDAFAKSLPVDRSDPALIDKNLLPPCGTKIDSVAAGSPAEKLGIQANWVVVTCNGKLLWRHSKPWEPASDTDPTREIVAVSPDGAEHRLSIPPGKIGVVMSTYEAPEKYLLTHMPRGKWDADMLIAMLSWEHGRHEITAEALLRASAKGMPANPPGDFLIALVAMERGNPGPARQLLAKLQKSPKPYDPLPRFYLTGLATIAFQFHDFPLLRRLIEDEVEDPGLIQPWAVDRWETPKLDLENPLLPRARRLAGENIISSIRTVRDPNAPDNALSDPAQIRRGTLLGFGEPGHTVRWYFGPPGPLHDMIWEMNVVFGNAKPPNEFANSVTFAIVIRKETKVPGQPDRIVHPGSSLASIAFVENRKGERWTSFAGSVSNGELFTRRVSPFLDAAQVDQLRGRKKDDPIPPGIATLRLTLIRLGNEVEICANDQPLLRLPVDPACGDVDCFIRTVGMAVAIKDMTLRPIPAATAQ